MKAIDAFLEAIKEAQVEFSERPYDFVSSEREAEFRLYQGIRSRLDAGGVQFTIQGDKCPQPPIVANSGERIRVEYFWRRKDALVKPDILILKTGAHIIEQAVPDEDVELIIELKVCWGGAGCGIALAKGLEQLQYYISNGLPAELVVFRADASTAASKNAAKDMISQDRTLASHVHIAFRDTLVHGDQV